MDLKKTEFMYIPRYVDQPKDYNYRDVITHEEYNEILNLNGQQGDYNTDVLRLLLTHKDLTKVPHIPYIDEIIEQIIDGRITVGSGIYALDVSEEDEYRAGIEYYPRANTVGWEHLTAALQEIIRNGGQAGTTDYNDLDNKPKINGISLIGNKTAKELNITGEVTEADLNNRFRDYYTKKDVDELIAAITGQGETTYSRVFVDSVPSGITPQEGDLLVYTV